MIHDHDIDRAFAPALRQGAPEEAAAFIEFNKHTVGRTNGAIPPKYREMIALGVALTTQCKYCLEGHVTALKKLGASREEIAEAVYIAAALRAGAAYTHMAWSLCASTMKRTGPMHLLSLIDDSSSRTC